MNSCHICATIPNRQFIMACDNCNLHYCLKCVKLQIEQKTKETNLINDRLSEIKNKKQDKAWLCFSCSKTCLCKQCRGIGISNLERQLLGKKEKTVYRRNFEEYKQSIGQIQIFKNMDLTKLTQFQKEYMINKAMLYCKPTTNVQTTNKVSSNQVAQTKKQPVKYVKDNVIMIDSDQNPQQMQLEQEVDNNNIEEQKPQQQKYVQIQVQDDKMQEQPKSIQQAVVIQTVNQEEIVVVTQNAQIKQVIAIEIEQSPSKNLEENSVQNAVQAINVNQLSRQAQIVAVPSQNHGQQQNPDQIQ